MSRRVHNDERLPLLALSDRLGDVVTALDRYGLAGRSAPANAPIDEPTYLFQRRLCLVRCVGPWHPRRECVLIAGRSSCGAWWLRNVDIGQLRHLPD